MVIRTRYLLAAALGLCVAQSLPAQEPGRLGPTPSSPLQATPTPNQRLADAVALTLRQGGQLRNYRVDLICADGAVELSGVVANQAQHDEVLRLVQGVPGVERVIDRLSVVESPTIVRTLAPATTSDATLTLPPADTKAAEPKGVAASDPLPLAYGPPQGSLDLNPPRMPPYAWPTYAPHNNFSRVAYPEAYPYNAWPYIGPVYPFPKVPLGWRSVKLEWQDGYWWFSKVATKYDWWRLKYW